MDTNIDISVKMIHLIYLYELIFLWMDTDLNLIYH